MVSWNGLLAKKVGLVSGVANEHFARYRERAHPKMAASRVGAIARPVSDLAQCHR